MKLRNLLLVAAGLAFSVPAWADTYSYTLATGNGIAGTTQSFTANGVTLNVSGYISGAAANLYLKNGGGTETGIGLANLPAHEIGGSGYVQLDLSNIQNSNPTAIMLALGSVDGNEMYSIYGSNSVGMPGSFLSGGGSSSANFTLSNPNNYRYISVSSPKGNVLLDGVTVKTSSVPEPGAASLLIAGFMSIVAAGMFFRRGITLGLRDRAAF